jgi:hypothetical protein
MVEPAGDQRGFTLPRDLPPLLWLPPDEEEYEGGEYES